MKDMALINVLVVDDFSTMRRVVRNMLREIGITNVTEATDGLAALERLQLGGVDLVITDVGMPDTHGLALVKAIRADPRFAHTAILAHTMVTGSIEAALQAGADSYTGWPFTTSTLHDKIEEIFGMNGS